MTTENWMSFIYELWTVEESKTKNMRDKIGCILSLKQCMILYYEYMYCFFFSVSFSVFDLADDRRKRFYWWNQNISFLKKNRSICRRKISDNRCEDRRMWIAQNLWVFDVLCASYVLLLSFVGLTLFSFCLISSKCQHISEMN